MRIDYSTWLGTNGLKAAVIARSLVVQRNDEGSSWLVFAIDGPVVHVTRVLKDSGDEQVDFEAAFPSMTGRPAPATHDGKPIFLPNLFPGGVYLYITGAGDGANTYGDGNLCQISSDAAGTTTAETQFKDWVYIAGGGIMFTGGVLGDHISLELYAPATPVTVNSNGTGNCNLVEVVPSSGLHIILPSAGAGTHDVDLAQAAPVPAADEVDGGLGHGYFNWSAPDQGKGTLTPNTQAQGIYNLYTFPISLVRFTNKFPLLGDHFVDITVPAVKPKKILPQWKCRVTVVNSGHTGLRVAWYFMTARTKTV
jgi:hypothetical protein